MQQHSIDILGVKTCYPQMKCEKNYRVEFDKQLHGNIQYIQRQPNLIQFLDLV